MQQQQQRLQQESQSWQKQQQQQQEDMQTNRIDFATILRPVFCLWPLRFNSFGKIIFFEKKLFLTIRQNLWLQPIAGRKSDQREAKIMAFNAQIKDLIKAGL